MLCRDFAVELQSSRVATTKVSKCNAMPLVRVSLAFQHNSTLGQKKGYERFTFCQHCKKKTRRTYHCTHFRTKRMGSLKTIEKNAGKWQSNRFLQNDAFLGFRVQAFKQNSYSEKDRNQTSGQNIPPYKM